ncbi:MAG: periplasmic heavy metal sensor [Rubrivivax sp.]|nr:periplasmic heavy metal sensor [Rubrivivax sp.]MDH5338581.1 periplasmic heavy metal sensor [Rubrivivax sp.]
MNRLAPLSFRRIAAVATLAAAGTLGLPGLAAASPGSPDVVPLGGRGLQHLLESADATPAQRTEIERIAAATRTDMLASRQTSQDLRRQLMDQFTQPTVDANAVEVLRKQMMAERDQASQRVMQSMLEISRVLSLEQRQKIAADMQQRADSMRRRMGHRGLQRGSDGAPDGESR